MSQFASPSGGDVIADLVELGGAGLVVTDLDAAAGRGAPQGPGAIRLGFSRTPDPGLDLNAFDILLCADPGAPAPWVGLPEEVLPQALERMQGQAARNPVASAVAAQVLRMTLALEFDGALALESLAYSALLGSQEFLVWREANPARSRQEADEPRVVLDVAEAAITVVLNRPWARNAVDAQMRDELVAALEFAIDHPDRPPVVLCGRGPAFCAGGDLDEFGRASDPGLAHLIRTLRSPARLAQALGERLTVRAHGACIGAGIEVAAAAADVTARPDAVFRLPEVAMGLIPGAGGTASIPRRIGRHRACYMAISGADIDADIALTWGLVDAVELQP